LRLAYLQRIPTIRRLQAGVVTAPKVARNAITGDNIVDGSVTGDNIAEGTINATHIEAGSITANEIAAQTITAEEIKANTITGEQINARSIGSEELAIGAIYAENIAAGAITADKIAANSIESQNLSASLRLTTPYIDGAGGRFVGVVAATRLITNDIIGVGPGDLEDPPPTDPNNPNNPNDIPLGIAPYIAMRPYLANPRTPENPTGDLTSQVTLWTDGRIELTATSFEAMELNDIKFAARDHRHENVVSHGQAHNPTRKGSDRRLKKDIEPLAPGLDLIEELEPVQFRMIDGDGSTVLNQETLEPLRYEDGEEVTVFREGKRTHFGLIAQDVQAIMDARGIDFSGHVIPDYDHDPDGLQQLDYSQFVAPLIKAVQELSEQNRMLASRVSDLESKIQ
jgi:Chaperone of endosialidase